MSEYDYEPIRGLPEVLPEDEHIRWQSSPDWKRMVLSALHVRLALIYFAVFAAAAVFRDDLAAAIAMVGFALVVTAFFALYAYGVERTCVYTLTNKRIVLRIGVALNKCINIPLSEIASADLKPLGGGAGNIVLTLKGRPIMGYTMLWPHARSLRIVRPQPMLRAIPEAESVAKLLFEETVLVQPVTKAQNESTAAPAKGLTA
jgi:hypothetical protein